MLPIKAEELPLHMIAEHWSRGFYPKAKKEELQATLEVAWLRGDLVVTNSKVRLGLLKTLYKIGSPHFCFLYPGAKPPIKEKTFKDGSVALDLRTIVPVPSKSILDWTDQNCGEAYAALAEFMSDENERGLKVLAEVVPDIVKPALHSLSVRREDFFSWIENQGFELPDFWAGRPAVTTPKPHAKNTKLSERKILEKLRAEFGPFTQNNPAPSQEAAIKFIGSLGYSGHRDEIRKVVRKLKADNNQSTSAGRPRKHK